jgi:hypothetical protein
MEPAVSSSQFPSTTPDAPPAEARLAEAELSMHWGSGPLGSETVALECPDRDALTRAVEILSEGFRRTCVDLAGGFAVLMSPSVRHDQMSRGAYDLVCGLAACREIPVEAHGSGRWKSPSGDQQAEPDEGFYVGDTALAYRRLRLRRNRGLIDVEELEAFEDAHPADLVVEVEHTRYALKKRMLCRRIGVGELWELGTEIALSSPAIVDLQAESGAVELASSRLIPGVRPENLPEAMKVLYELGGLVEVVRGLERKDDRPQRLMRAAGIDLD